MEDQLRPIMELKKSVLLKIIEDTLQECCRHNYLNYNSHINQKVSSDNFKLCKYKKESRYFVRNDDIPQVSDETIYLKILFIFTFCRTFLIG